MDKVKWGILGTAGIARGCTIPGLKKSESSELYAIAGRKLSLPHNYALEIENLSRCILYGDKPHISKDFSIKNAEFIDSVLDEIGFWKTR